MRPPFAPTLGPLRRGCGRARRTRLLLGPQSLVATPPPPRGDPRRLHKIAGRAGVSPLLGSSYRAMIVELSASDSRYPDLTPGQPYVVIGIEADDLRVLNDQGRPYLYSSKLFEVVDPHEPADWVTEVGEDGERYAYPPALDVVGFFEDFFDDQRQAVTAFWQVVNQRLALAVV